MRAGVLILCLVGAVRAGDYDFAIPEAEKKPYELGGRLEGRYLYHRLDRDSARYRLDAVGDDPGREAHEWRGVGELWVGYRRGIFQANLLTHHEFGKTQAREEWDHALYEGYVTLTPTASLTVDVGKKRLLWGKGYAWNPSGFINRPKDPDDPALTLEGRTLLGVDLIKSFAAGPVTNMGLTALVLPVIDDWANKELGDDGDLNTAVKLYLLWRDTDLELIGLDGPQQPRSIGFGFARNLAENIAVHGEAAWQRKAARLVLDAAGGVHRERKDRFGFLLGARYLNALDTTFILEYYRNGAGYDRSEIQDFFIYQRAAFERWQTLGDAAAMQRADQVTRPYYQQRNYGRDYVYLKISQKEPLDLLYFTPWAATVVNLNDGSFNLQPGLTWAPLTDVELNLRVGIPVGPGRTEFGEKPDAVRPEVWVRCVF
jgi:hypothetical protein